MKPAIPGRRPRGARAGFKPAQAAPAQVPAYRGALRHPAPEGLSPAAPVDGAPLDCAPVEPA